MNLIIYIFILFTQNEVVASFLHESITIVDGKSLIIPCRVPRRMDKNLPLHNCTWSRTKAKTEYTNFPHHLHDPKYISAGNIEAGDCSLNITRVQLEADAGIWKCALEVRDTTITLAMINVTVLVEPLDPKLYLNGTDTLIAPNSTTYLDPDSKVDLKLKCVSQMAYPPTILIWKVNGKGIIPKSEETFSDVRPSTFMTVSSIQITPPTLIFSPIRVSCIAFHPSYSGIKILYANFSVASYAPTFSRIQSGCELKDSEENEIFKVEENQILPLLCMTKGIPLPSVQWEMKNEYNEWNPIFKHALQFAYFIQSAGMYRCVTSNKMSETKTISPPVLVEMEHSKTESRDGSALLDPRSRHKTGGFYVQPKDITVVVNTPFKLNCILNVPVDNCTWTQNGHVWSTKDKGRVDVLNEYKYGICVIYFKAAHVADAGNWVCNAAYTYKKLEKVISSRNAQVFILHPPTSLILTYEGKERVNGARIFINTLDQRVAILRCTANSWNKNEQIIWWINNRPESFPQTKSTLLSLDTYEISSAVSLSINKLPRQVKKSEIYVKCTINNQGPEIILNLKFPTRKVMLVPSGAVYLLKNSFLRLHCNANGIPSPEVTLQRQVGGDWQWMKSIPQRRWFTVKRIGVYRCVAKNILNQNYLHSKSAIILPTTNPSLIINRGRLRRKKHQALRTAIE